MEKAGLSSETAAKRPSRGWRLFRGWLVTGVVSAGAGSLLVILFVLPWTIRSWEKVEADLPPSLASWNEQRFPLAFVAVVLTVAGGVALFLRLPMGIRVAIYLLCLLLLLAAAVAGLLGWWWLYIDLMRQATEI